MKALRVVGKVVGIGGRWLIGGILIIGHLFASLIGIILTAICSSR